MNGEVVYSKKYTHTELFAIKTPATKARSSADEEHRAFEKFHIKLLEPVDLTPIPGRDENAALFIHLAIEAAELYQLDTVITRHESRISVDYSFDCGGCMKYVLPVFKLADECSFFTGIFGREITVSLEYYTHYVCKNGKVIAP